ALGCLRERLDHRGHRVPEDERSPRAQEVEVGAPVDVLDARARGAGHEEGSAAHTAKRPHGAVHAPGNQSLGGLEERLGACHGAFPPQRAALGTLNSMGRKSRWMGSHAKALAATGRAAITETTT